MRTARAMSLLLSPPANPSRRAPRPTPDGFRSLGNGCYFILNGREHEGHPTAWGSISVRQSGADAEGR